MSEPAEIKSACEHCGGHIQFPAEAVGMAVDCPHCGWRTQLTAPATPALPTTTRGPATASRRSGPRLLAAGLLFLIAGGGFFWATRRARSGSPAPLAQQSNSLPSAVVPPPRSGLSTNGLAIGDVALEKTGKSKVVYAVGVVGNNLPRQRFGLRIELDLFDAGGDKVGTATDYLSVLEPGKEWRFKAMVLESKAVSAKLAAIKEDQ